MFINYTRDTLQQGYVDDNIKRLIFNLVKCLGSQLNGITEQTPLDVK